MKTLAKWRARLVNDTDAHDYNKIQLMTVQDVIFETVCREFGELLSLESLRPFCDENYALITTQRINIFINGPFEEQ